MSVVARCDGCGREVLNKSRTELPLHLELVNPEAPGRSIYERVPATLNDWHFCAVACVATWAVSVETAEAIA